MSLWPLRVFCVPVPLFGTHVSQFLLYQDSESLLEGFSFPVSSLLSFLPPPCLYLVTILKCSGVWVAILVVFQRRGSVLTLSLALVLSCLWVCARRSRGGQSVTILQADTAEQLCSSCVGGSGPFTGRPERSFEGWFLADRQALCRRC